MRINMGMVKCKYMSVYCQESELIITGIKRHVCVYSKVIVKLKSNKFGIKSHMLSVKVINNTKMIDSCWSACV
jgi:hypothetical protein